ncbi:tetratricopeptide repeat protein [Parafilimonas terrae]|jgi:Tfp pilus assembly protein PilF|uniref:Tetratricopeptide repeat-containing protein n=1 Tax=Parafilimonas terrae TaxID=1465490 RepID=A0A1I5ZDS7_9BACT|nr:tetratricopeptide repeat protein [Parafilimonas terrae]SFQ54598.1 Tetratricopeptide repeat-containing protein [Parafilimonas terrae]
MGRIEKLQELLQQMPDDSFLRHALALEYIKLNNDKDAKALFEAVLKNEPGYVGSYYHLGKLLERNGETALAIEWYEKGMQQAKAANDQHAYNELQAAYEDLVY